MLRGRFRLLNSPAKEVLLVTNGFQSWNWKFSDVDGEKIYMTIVHAKVVNTARLFRDTPEYMWAKFSSKL